MDYLSLWKLTIDGFFILAIGYLAYRLWQQSKQPVNLIALRELEVSLRGLLKEAERSGVQLSDELSRKKRALEQLLYDVEGAEQRIQRNLTEADSSLRGMQERSAQAARAERVSHLATNEQELHRPAPSLQSKASTTSTEAYQPYDYPRVSRPAPSKVAESQPKPKVSRASNVPVNIYGEPIGSSNDQRSSLADSIEKVIEPAMDEQLTRSLEDIYSSAEEMLRAGEKLERIAAITRLPIGEVQMLAQMVEQENQELADPQPQEDRRRGALGNIQRNRHVL